MAGRIVAAVSGTGDPARMPDDPVVIRARLAIACERRDREPPFSPDWDAAMSEIDELSARLARRNGGASAQRPAREGVWGGLRGSNP